MVFLLYKKNVFKLIKISIWFYLDYFNFINWLEFGNGQFYLRMPQIFTIISYFSHKKKVF